MRRIVKRLAALVQCELFGHVRWGTLGDSPLLEFDKGWQRRGFDSCVRCGGLFLSSIRPSATPQTAAEEEQRKKSPGWAFNADTLPVEGADVEAHNRAVFLANLERARAMAGAAMVQSDDQLDDYPCPPPAS